MPLVSAIITTHNRETEMVERALKSVLAQTHKETEIIIVDDSSPDFPCRKDVAELARKHGAVYIANETPLGACKARNIGLQNSSGEYIAFLDDDDEWLPEKTEKELSKLCGNTALVYCNCIVVNDDTGERKENKLIKESGNVFGKLIKNNFIGGCSFTLMRADILKKLGGFDEEMASAQDFELWLRIAKEYDIDYISESLVLYHIHESGRISSNYEKRIKGQSRLYEINKEYIDSHPDVYHKRIMMLALQYAEYGDREKALSLWKSAASKKPFAIKENISYKVLISKEIKNKGNK